jgi:hypothetical protein
MADKFQIQIHYVHIYLLVLFLRWLFHFKPIEHIFETQQRVKTKSEGA